MDGAAKELSRFKSVDLRNSNDVSEIVFEKETVFSNVKRKFRKVRQNITLEPIFLLESIFCGLDHVSNHQLTILKSCTNDFDFPNGTCDDLIHHKENNTAVQNEVAQFNVYVTIITHVFPFITAFYFGSWSDKFGRKWIMYIGYMSWVLRGGFHMLNVYFIDWPKEYLLLEYIPYALSGGGVAFGLSLGAFIADISDPDQRAFRMFLFSFPWKIGSPIGTQLGKYLFDQGSFICVSSATFLFKIICFALFVIRLELYYRNEDVKKKVEASKQLERNKKKVHPLSLDHIKESVFVVTRKRENNKRFYLILYIGIIFAGHLSFEGESSVAYNYVRTRYGWEVNEYSDFSTITHIIDTVGQAMIIPLISYFELSSSNLVPVLMSTITARHLIKALAKDSWMLYLSSTVDFMGTYSFSLSKALATNCVETAELGKAFALLSSIDSIAPIALSQLYTTLWKETSDLGAPWVGACFFLSAGLSLIAVFLSCVGMFSLKGRDTADLWGDKVQPQRYIPSVTARMDQGMVQISAKSTGLKI